jgi:prepilin-type N-terminal cleavage/methylation domain-containing protein
MNSTAQSRRGFTLVELLVSLTAALFITMSVFALARQTGRQYQRETHVANASLASVVGFERLRADLLRAGFMASPNVQRDPFVCGSPLTDSWPTELKEMASLRIEDIRSDDLPEVIGQNDLTPQSIVMAGNYVSSEAFPIRSVAHVNGTYEVYLQVMTGAMARLGYLQDGANQKALLESVFPPGRAVRIADKSGRYHYGVLSSVVVGDQPKLVLVEDAPPIKFRNESAIGCGLRGEETGAMVNTVNFIRYTLKSLADDDRYAPLYSAATGPDTDADRIELVREELDPNGDVIADSAELVAEYAVDLRFQLTVAPSQRSALLFVDSSDVADWAGPLEGISAGRGPQLVRTVHAWLSVRSRDADREADIPVEQGPRFRMGLGPSGGAPFARLRTVQAHIAMHNQMGATWQ